MVVFSNFANVDTPVIGRKYHIAWAKKKGMVWVLRKVIGRRAFLSTPKTNKPINCDVADLRELNKVADMKQYQAKEDA